MAKYPNRKLILEDGQQYFGFSFGDTSDKVLEIVFNTSMTGYQEILSDPSYTDQAVVMTYPLIGNYGMADDDYETETPTIGALIVHSYNDEPSNFRSAASLDAVMQRYGIAGISGVDTRKLNRSIRDFGTRKALITGISTSLEAGLKILQKSKLPHDAVSRVSSKGIWQSPAQSTPAQSTPEVGPRAQSTPEVGTPEVGPQVGPRPRPPIQAPQGRGAATTPAQSGAPAADIAKPFPFHVVLIDCGMKRNILRSLNRRGCDVTVVPWNTSAAAVRALHPDGILISNGPGDPNDVPQTIETVRELLGFCPIFGICLGHQILSLAYGARTYKLKFGHRGGNHPVRNLETGQIEITSQNHSYAVDPASLKGTPLGSTHVNILDNTIEGVKCERDRAFSVQYHPESAPGPQDSAYLFDNFLNLMKENLMKAEKEVPHAQAH